VKSGVDGKSEKNSENKIEFCLGKEIEFVQEIKSVW
jgi:hypothetical protein